MAWPPITPYRWDWTTSATPNASTGFHLYLVDGAGRKIAALWGREEEKVANANLLSRAPDHALIGWAMCVGAGRWEPLGEGLHGELCMNGLRHLTVLDPFGIPVVTAGMRAAIVAAMGPSAPGQSTTLAGTAKETDNGRQADRK